MAGCTDPDPDIPKPEVKTVSAYGVTLDESATCQQVAYVLLRAIADDVTAAQNHDREKQKQALDLTFSLAAYSQIEKQIHVAEQRESPNDQKNKKLYKTVKFWAPIFGHYIKSFDTDWPAAQKNLQVELSKDQQNARVYRKVVHDPAQTDPEKQQTATIDITLAKEKAGDKSYWRVVRVGYRKPTGT